MSMTDERTRLVEYEEHDQSISRTHSMVVDMPSSTPLKWGPLLIVVVFTTMLSLAFEIISPFVNQMILETGVVTEPESAGYYSGIIDSVYSCVSLIMVIPGSVLADRIGRKPVILGGTLGLAISVVCFGMSKSFLSMVLSRSLGGTRGAAWACTKITLGEMTDRSNQGMAFTANTVAYRIGQIVGLPLGGLLAHPERQISWFRTSFWYEYPFALPCFVAAALCVAAITMGCFLLQETLWSKQKHQPVQTVYGAIGTSSPPSLLEVSRVETPPAEQNVMLKYKSIITPSIVALLLSNAAMSFSSTALYAVLPLFSFTPIDSGGLGMSEAAIGIQMGVRGVANIVLMALFPPLQRRLGTVCVYQLAMWAWPLTTLCFPLLNLLARQAGTNGWLFVVGFSIFLIIWSV